MSSNGFISALVCIAMEKFESYVVEIIWGWARFHEYKQHTFVEIIFPISKQ